MKRVVAGMLLLVFAVCGMESSLEDERRLREFNLQFDLLALPGVEQDIIHAVVYTQPVRFHLSIRKSDGKEFLQNRQTWRLLYGEVCRIISFAKEQANFSQNSMDDYRVVQAHIICTELERFDDK